MVQNSRSRGWCAENPTFGSKPPQNARTAESLANSECVTFGNRLTVCLPIFYPPFLSHFLISVLPLSQYIRRPLLFYPVLLPSESISIHNLCLPSLRFHCPFSYRLFQFHVFPSFSSLILNQINQIKTSLSFTSVSTKNSNLLR